MSCYYNSQNTNSYQAMIDTMMCSISTTEQANNTRQGQQAICGNPSVRPALQWFSTECGGGAGTACHKLSFLKAAPEKSCQRSFGGNFICEFLPDRKLARF